MVDVEKGMHEMMVLQEARCPACKGIWDLHQKDFVGVGELLK